MLTHVLTKRKKIDLFKSGWFNFAIGFLYPIIYSYAMDVIPPQMTLMDSELFVLCFLPIPVFVPLILLSYLILRKTKKLDF
jgi:hypothetical protein